MKAQNWTRRDFLKTSAATAMVAATGPSLTALAAEPKNVYPRGKADACIFIWLGGGAAQIDTFDPKGRGDGKKTAGCYYNTIGSAISGVLVSEHLKRTAPLLD